MRNVRFCSWQVPAALWLLLLGCSAPRGETVHVAAAASTREALEQISRDFQQETGITIDLNLGASSELVRQIEQGAPSDIFVSADESWADHLASEGLVAERRNRLTNRLVVVVPAGLGPSPASLADLVKPAFHRIALAAPAVPAGRYARQALTKAGIWNKIRDRALESRDVRAALTYVARAEAEAGLVYATDALQSEDVRVAIDIPADFHQPIYYPVVLVQRDPITGPARRFFEYLNGEQAAVVFHQAGFGVLP
jgi:molybdate transport system substrate-binding protein